MWQNSRWTLTYINLIRVILCKVNNLNSWRYSEQISTIYEFFHHVESVHTKLKFFVSKVKCEVLSSHWKSEMSFRCVLKHDPQREKLGVCPNICRRVLSVPSGRRKLRRQRPDISTAEPGVLARGVSVNQTRPSVDAASFRVTLFSRGNGWGLTLSAFQWLHEIFIWEWMQERLLPHLLHTVCCTTYSMLCAEVHLFFWLVGFALSVCWGKIKDQKK